jgi:hypothetical protein
MQQKTYIKYLVVVWLQLLFKVLFIWKCIKIIFLFIKKYFLYQRIKMIWKHKKILIWSKKINFFQKHFWNAKTNKVLRNSTTKTCKNYFSNTTFQTQFFSRPRNKKCNLMCCQTPYYVFYTTNRKTTSKQMQPVFVTFIYFDSLLIFSIYI